MLGQGDLYSTEKQANCCEVRKVDDYDYDNDDNDENSDSVDDDNNNNNNNNKATYM
jgi:hypothetical protein